MAAWIVRLSVSGLAAPVDLVLKDDTVVDESDLPPAGDRPAEPEPIRVDPGGGGGGRVRPGQLSGSGGVRPGQLVVVVDAGDRGVVRTGVSPVRPDLFPRQTRFAYQMEILADFPVSQIQIDIDQLAEHVRGAAMTPDDEPAVVDPADVGVELGQADE